MSKNKNIVLDDSVTKEVVKKYGHVVRTGIDVFEESSNLKIISVSPALDVALGGGIREGSWVIFTGEPKTGKTTTALQFAANCQREENGSRPVIFINAEGRLKSMNLGGVRGLDIEKIRIVESDAEPMSAEEYLDIVVKYVSKEPECVVIIDSASALIPERELIEDVSGQFRAGLPKILAAFTRRLSNVVTKQRAIIILITHYIANTSGMGRKTKLADGGKKIQSQADTNRIIEYIKPWESGGRSIGQQINWKVLCSSSGGFPGSTAQGWLRYGIGVDSTQELLIMGVEFGLISKAGAWYRCDFLENHGEKYSEMSETKFQGQDKLYNFIDQNPDVMNLLNEELKAIL